MNLRPTTQVDVSASAWKCSTCNKHLGAFQYDDDGREYRDCDCTRKARKAASDARKAASDDG